VHEAGHLFAALMVEWKPVGLMVGRRKSKKLFRVGGVSICVGSFPFGGSAFAVARNPSHFRLKFLIFIMGGPVASISLFVLLVTLMASGGWMERLPEWWQVTISCLIVIEAGETCGYLFPYYFREQGQRIPTDALRIFQTLTMKESEVPARLASYCSFYTGYLIREDRLTEAKAFLSGMSEVFRDGLSARVYLIECLRGNDRALEADAEIEILIREGVPGEARAEILDALACIPLLYRDSEFVKRALGYIEEAIGEEPGKITLTGTKGTLLIEDGRLDEGIQLLGEVREKSDAARDKMYCEYYLALAYHQKKDRLRAMEHLKAAIEIAPKSHLRPRIEKAIRGAVGR
jgi:hypothetical protein